MTPDQLSDFEDFAYDFYNTSRIPEPFPNGTATSSFGKGVWGVNPKLNTTDNRYHETDGSTYYNSPNKLFAPILQHNAGVSHALLLNIRYEQTRGEMIDTIIDCSNQRQQLGDESISCIGMTDMLFLAGQNVADGPSALILQPVYAADRSGSNQLLELVGLISSAIVWSEVLVNVFADEVDGVDCVLETDTQVYTYRVHAGHASLL